MSSRRILLVMTSLLLILNGCTAYREIAQPWAILQATTEPPFSQDSPAKAMMTGGV
ncbi:MAG TPA: hypothetical protein PK018_17000 [Candidatus Competibacter sp.]|nr:hypothetical protein [Candidatus Competibacter sp.]